MFDIPMNSKGAMDSSGLMGLMGGAQPAPPASQPSAPVPAPVPAPAPKPRGNMGTGVHLKKGQKFALPALNRLKVCLGWDVTNRACDLDASAFMVDANNRVIGDDWFVFYGQLDSPDRALHHSGDSQGEGSGDDETITINVPQIDPRVQKIIFVVSINEALEQGLNFSMVSNAYVRVVNEETNQELAYFGLTEYYNNVTAMMVGELYRYQGQWKFNAIGDGVAKDLYGLCAMYGVNVAD